MKRKSALGLLLSTPLLATPFGAARVSAAGGTLRVGSIAQPNTLNPLLASLQIEQHLYSAIFSGLLGLDEKSRLIPDLAETVPTKENGGVSADLKSITYVLRERARWHDGVPVTADDVAYTFARIMDPAVTFPARSRYEIVNRIETRGPRAVVFHLKEPTPDATMTLFVNGFNGSIVPKHVLEGTADWHRAPFNGQPIGSGPYQVVRWERGTQVVLRANPAYFAGAPSIETIELKFVPDANTLTIGMKSGATDLVYEPPPATLPMLDGTTNVKIVPVLQDSVQWLIVNTTAKVVGDPKVRRALCLAIDREQMAKNVYRGYAKRATGLVPPWSPYATSNEKDDRPDPDAARSLLDAAGWKLTGDGKRMRDGKPLAIDITTVAGSPQRQGMALLLQASWKALGIEVGIRSFPINALVAPDGIFARGDFQIGLAGFAFAPTADRSQLLASSSKPPHGFNYALYKNPEVDRLIEMTNRTADGPQRAAYFHQIAGAVARDRPLVPLLWIVNANIVSNSLQGYKPGPDAALFWNVSTWRLTR